MSGDSVQQSAVSSFIEAQAYLIDRWRSRKTVRVKKLPQISSDSCLECKKLILHDRLVPKAAGTASFSKEISDGRQLRPSAIWDCQLKETISGAACFIDETTNRKFRI
jgi:hypothetical protein